MQDILTQALCYIAIMILGYVLNRRGFFGKNAFPILSAIVIKITLPATIIASSSGKPIDTDMLLLPALGFGFGVVYMAVGALSHKGSSKNKQAFAILNTPGYNIGVFTMPFIQGFLGPMGVISATLFDVGNAFICLGGAYGVACSVKAGENINFKRIFQALSHSVPFLVYLMVAILNLLGWTLPSPVVSFAGIIGNANLFLAMLMIGVGFEMKTERSYLGTMARILLCRYGLAVLIAGGIYFLLPFALIVRQTLVILAFSPFSSAIPGFTAELKEDVGLASALNSISVIISITIIVSLLMIML